MRLQTRVSSVVTPSLVADEAYMRAIEGDFVTVQWARKFRQEILVRSALYSQMGQLNKISYTMESWLRRCIESYALAELKLNEGKFRLASSRQASATSMSRESAMSYFQKNLDLEESVAQQLLDLLFDEVAAKP